MNSKELISEQLVRFIESTTPEVLCISGDWGVGKTYLWKHTLEKCALEGRIGLLSYAYCSLFGVTSLDALKRSIFENTESFKPTPLSGMASRLHLRKGISYVRFAPKVGDLLEKLSALSFNLVKNQVICIDDLERRSQGLSVKEVFGLISFLKEERECKIVLLLNDEALDDAGAKEFGEHLEKTIGIHLKYDPSPADSLGIALPKDDDLSAMIRARCAELQICNIRVIQKIDRLCQAVAELLKPFLPQVLDQAVRSVALLGWIHLQPLQAPTIEFLKRNDYGARLIATAKEAAVDPTQSAWVALLDAYGFRSLDEFDEVILSGIRLGYFDKDRIIQHASTLNEKAQQQTVSDAFDAAWSRYRDSFDNDVDGPLDDIFSTFKPAVQIITPVNLDATLKLFKDLRRTDQAKELLQFYIDNRHERRDFWDVDYHSTMSEIGDDDLREAMAQKFNTFKPESFELGEFLDRLGGPTGCTEEEVIIASELGVDSYYKLFKTTNGRPLSKIINGALLANRLAGASPQMKSIASTTAEALRRIGCESPINARRVLRFGIDVRPSTEKEGIEIPPA